MGVGMEVEVDAGVDVNAGLKLFIMPSCCGLHVHLGT